MQSNFDVTMSIKAYMVSLFFVQFCLGPKNLVAAQATPMGSPDPTPEITNSVEKDKGYFILDRTVERLHALHYFVDDRISKVKTNVQFFSLKKIYFVLFYSTVAIYGSKSPLCQTSERYKLKINK